MVHAFEDQAIDYGEVLGPAFSEYSTVPGIVRIGQNYRLPGIKNLADGLTEVGSIVAPLSRLS